MRGMRRISQQLPGFSRDPCLPAVLLVGKFELHPKVALANRYVPIVHFTSQDTCELISQARPGAALYEPFDVWQN